MNSSVKMLKITAVALTIVTIVLVVADAVALFYLYSFDRDPKNWTNLNVFYSRPKHIFVGREIDSKEFGSLVVRGNDRNSSYAIQYRLTLADIKPSVLHDCLLAVEDRRFYRHTGMDYLSIFKALYDYLIHRERLRGASTISNQLMRTVVLADQSRSGLQGIGRKIAETVLTTAAERHFSKDDLLVSYINNVPIGHLNQTALIGFSAAGVALFG
jgi:membrane peptidoglycan carboxypeptidase